MIMTLRGGIGILKIRTARAFWTNTTATRAFAVSGAIGQTMETVNPVTLPEHYEKHLGQIARGWSDEKRMHGIQVVSFERQPEPGVKTYATLGLSRHIVELPHSKEIRQELLLSANDSFPSASVAGLVLSLAEHVLRRGRALLRGEVVGPATPVISGSALTAIYVTNPSPFNDSLSEYKCEYPPIVFAYLIPITTFESALIQKKGWNWFEEQLEEQNPDIWDLMRSDGIFE
jgi:hypothetical protein